jgi:hypothetical protein
VLVIIFLVALANSAKMQPRYLMTPRQQLLHQAAIIAQKMKTEDPGDLHDVHEFMAEDVEAFTAGTDATKEYASHLDHSSFGCDINGMAPDPNGCYPSMVPGHQGMSGAEYTISPVFTGEAHYSDDTSSEDMASSSVAHRLLGDRLMGETAAGLNALAMCAEIPVMVARSPEQYQGSQPHSTAGADSHTNYADDQCSATGLYMLAHCAGVVNSPKFQKRFRMDPAMLQPNKRLCARKYDPVE